MKNNHRRTLVWSALTAAAAVAALAAVVVLATSAPSRNTADPHYPTAEVTTHYPEPDPAEYHDPTAVADLPVEVQVYVSMARGLVKNGTVPRDRVTATLVQTDIMREYGISLNAAQTDYVVSEILR